jgi:transposase
VPHVAASSNHAKKKTKRAEAQQREDVKAARQQFEDERKTLQAADVMALDAMGGVTGMSRRDGYAPCGARAVSYEPAGKGTRLSLIGALSVDGLLGGLEVTGSINGDVCEALIEQVVVPHLRPGKVVLLDHIPFHHRESIRELVETQGATLKFLPASSPEFNPIEACWSKLKAWLRRKAARTVPALQEAITEAIQQVTRSDAEGWFRHAGYQFNSNE